MRKLKLQMQTSLDGFVASREGQLDFMVWDWNEELNRYVDEITEPVDLIYIDPPFGTGIDFSVSTVIGDDGVAVTKEQSLIEEKAYRDTWELGPHSYLTYLRDRLLMCRELLTPTGSIFVQIGDGLPC